MRLLIHPGFHKTGTTTLQTGLLRNADVLEPRLRVLLTEDFQQAVTAARRHTTDPAPKRLESYANGLDATFARLDPKDPRPVLTSCEKFLGWIPGRKDNWAYTAAPDFMARLVDVLTTRFGADAEITLFFTTREALAWQRSVYWQNLKVMRVTEDFETYSKRLEAGAQLEEVVQTIRATLGERPGLKVVSRAVESFTENPQGALGAALSLLDVETSGLVPYKSYNMQPAGAAEALLALNRSDRDDAALAKAKQALLKSYQRAGKTRGQAKA